MQLEAARYFREAGTALLGRLRDEWPPVRKQADDDLEAWLRRMLADPAVSAERLADALQPYIEQAVAAGAASADRRTAPSVRISWDLRNEEAVRWLRRWRIPFRRQVDETTHNEILRRLRDGIDRGAPFEEIANDLRSLFSAWERWRAELIAHTEGVRALSEGQLIYWKSARVTIVRFVTAQDELTCPICLPLHGREMRLEDARGFIPRHPRCRCYWEPVRTAERRPPRRVRPPMVGAVPQPAPPQRPPVPIWDESRIRTGEEADAALDRLMELAAEDMRRRLATTRTRGRLRFGGALLELELAGETIEIGLGGGLNLNPAQVQAWNEAFNAEPTIIEQWQRIQQLIAMRSEGDKTRAEMVLANVRRKLVNWGVLQVYVTEAMFEGKAPEGYRPWLGLHQKIGSDVPSDLQQHFATMARLAARWLDLFVRGPLANVVQVREVGYSPSGRAYYSGQREGIFMGAGSDLGVWVHEIGHHLHWSSRTAISLVDRWFRRRAGSEEPSLIYPHKDAGKPPEQQERGVRDKFMSHYVGKIYPYEPARGTEVVSMGLEYFETNALEFLLGDPDHARLIWGLAKGLGADG